MIWAYTHTRVYIYGERERDTYQMYTQINFQKKRGGETNRPYLIRLDIVGSPHGRRGHSGSCVSDSSVLGKAASWMQFFRPPSHSKWPSGLEHLTKRVRRASGRLSTLCECLSPCFKLNVCFSVQRSVCASDGIWPPALLCLSPAGKGKSPSFCHKRGV